ncbi:MAG TPA: helix-hairpin-helix domain-containing protein [Gemmatimonadaceae bacterium]
MPTANEKKALWFLALVALSGSGVRLWRAKMPDAGATESAALDRQIGRVDSVRALRHQKSDARENKQPGGNRDTLRPEAKEASSPIDLDQATTGQIESLPGIGPALAKRIVAHRDSAGAYGQIDALCEVRGIGPALSERLRPLVTFTGAHRPLSAACGDSSNRTPKMRRARTRQLR